MKCRRNVSGELQTLESAHTLYFMSLGMHSDDARYTAHVELFTRFICGRPLIAPAFGDVEVRT